MRSLLFCIYLALLFPDRVLCIQCCLKLPLFVATALTEIKRSNEFWKLERVRSCEDT